MFLGIPFFILCQSRENFSPRNEAVPLPLCTKNDNARHYGISYWKGSFFYFPSEGTNRKKRRNTALVSVFRPRFSKEKINKNIFG